jgi:hypothetical protein
LIEKWHWLLEAWHWLLEAWLGVAAMTHDFPTNQESKAAKKTFQLRLQLHRR